MNAQITWHEDRKTGKGILTLKRDDGTAETVEHSEPINASTDSHHIAGLFGGFVWVEHVGNVVHVGV